MAKPLELPSPLAVADQPISGCWPVHFWARYIESRPPAVDTIDWGRPLTFVLRVDAYLSAGGSWTQMFIVLLNHGKRGRTPAYLVGHWDGRVRLRKHGRFGHYCGPQPLHTWRLCVALSLRSFHFEFASFKNKNPLKFKAKDI